MTASPTTPPPAAAPTPQSLYDRVEAVINALRPFIQYDGGDLELVGVSPDGKVEIRFHGACIGCPSSDMTLRDGIERNIRQKVPEVTQVISLNN